MRSGVCFHPTHIGVLRFRSSCCVWSCYVYSCFYFIQREANNLSAYGKFLRYFICCIRNYSTNHPHWSSMSNSKHQNDLTIIQYIQYFNKSFFRLHCYARNKCFSTDSFKLANSFRNETELVIELFNRLPKNADSVRNKTRNSLYEWVSESCPWPIR